MSLWSLKRQLRREKVTTKAARRGRYIPSLLYQELKSKSVCDRCGSGKQLPLEIHHKTPVSKGGSNDRSNLEALCRDCHKKAHEEDLL